MCWIPVREKKIVFRWNPAHFRATAPNLRSFKNGAEIGPNRKSGCSIADQLTKEEGWPLPSHLTILCHSLTQFTPQKTSNLTWQTLFSILHHDEFSTFARGTNKRTISEFSFNPHDHNSTCNSHDSSRASQTEVRWQLHSRQQTPTAQPRSSTNSSVMGWAENDWVREVGRGLGVSSPSAYLVPLVETTPWWGRKECLIARNEQEALIFFQD